MRMIYTLILVTATAAMVQAQRNPSKLYFRCGSSGGTIEIERASGSGGFTDSTRWFVQTTPGNYKALSSYGSTGGANAIRETDTLVIEGIEMVMEHGKNITLPQNVRFVYLGAPRTNGVTMFIDNGTVFKMTNSMAAMSLSATGILKLGAGAVSPTQIVMVNTVKALNSTAAPIQTTGQAINGATIGASAYSAQLTSVATPTSNFGGFINLGALPVVLVSFDAQKQSAGVNLRWTTQQESNLDEFIVEKSTDGKTYTLAGRVPATGNSSTPQNYSFTDPSLLTGIAFFRVRMLDLDGKQGLTSIKAVRATQSSVKVGIYPNPAVTHANIVTNASAGVPAFIAVYNQQGMIVHSQSNLGGNSFTIDLGKYNAGQYLVEVKFADGSRQTERLFVNKR